MSRKQRGFQRSATFLTAPLPADTVTNREKGGLKFLYPCALEINAEDDLLADGDIKTNLENWLKTHQKYLKPSQVACLADIYARDLQQEDDDIFYLVTVEEYKNIMQNELGITGKIGKWGFESDLGSFKYMQD